MDRIERHDIINAVGLAAVLLAMAMALVLGARSLLGTVGGDEEQPGIIDSQKTPDATTTTTTGSTLPPTTSTSIALPHPNDQVVAIVGNAAGRSGIAGAGTRLMDQAGYSTLGPKNASGGVTKSSIIYYLDGYKADAEQAARLLGIPEVNVAPMPDDPGVPKGDAMLVVILGADTTVG